MYNWLCCSAEAFARLDLTLQAQSCVPYTKRYYSGHCPIWSCSCTRRLRTRYSIATDFEPLHCREACLPEAIGLVQLCLLCPVWGSLQFAMIVRGNTCSKWSITSMLARFPKNITYYKAIILQNARKGLQAQVTPRTCLQRLRAEYDILTGVALNCQKATWM